MDESNINESLLSEKDQIKYKKRLEKANMKREKRQKENEIYEVNIDSPKMGRFKMETSKILMYLILINCFMIEVYSMWIMYTLQDLSALYSLIGAVVTSSITFAIYCVKAYKGKKSAVDSQLERDKFESSLEGFEFDDGCEEEDEDEEPDADDSDDE